MEGEGEDVAKAGHFVQKSLVDLRETSGGEVKVYYKSDVTIVGKLAIFGDRIMIAKAKKVEKEFTHALHERLKSAF